MAGSSLLTLLDDIATVLDDVSVMTKVAAKKTAGVLGDDLALNAQQVSGVTADRELPVVWAVAKGSLKNKVILVPAALLISAIAPWAITPILMIGGAFLCYEGFEKLVHAFHRDSAEDQQHHDELVQALSNSDVDIVAFEKDKIKGAIRTDFILSAEIIVIALGTVADASFAKQVAVLCGIAAIMTVGVYGLVAGIVKLDDAGFYLNARTGESLWKKALRSLGRFLLFITPYLMKTLTIVGTAAMFLVGGGIIAHGIPQLHDPIHHLSESAGALPGAGSFVQALVPTVVNAVVGIMSGAAVLAGVSVIAGIVKRFKRKSAG